MWAEAVAEPRVMATLVYLDALTRDPRSVGKETIDRALANGATAAELEQATLSCFAFSYMNRMVDAFGADVTPDEARTIGDAMDAMAGAGERVRRLKPWQRFEGVLPKAATNQLAIIRTGEGDCPVEVRTAIEARVALASGAERAGSTELPVEVAALADTLAADAHGVTDEHIAALKAATWSEEAIYEMVFVAAFAAGIGRTERAVRLLAEY